MQLNDEKLYHTFFLPDEAALAAVGFAAGFLAGALVGFSFLADALAAVLAAVLVVVPVAALRPILRHQFEDETNTNTFLAGVRLEVVFLVVGV